MPTPTFKRVSVAEFDRILARFPFTRRINAVHMHHTWRPERRDFRGHETIVSMWRFHTREMGWRDIAQHITIDPEGFIWLGRNWNLPPASAAGHNGNATAGPFMFEMIGNFDKGHDPFDGEQRETALQVIALVQARFGLAPNTLMFHNALSGKSCPGNSLDYEAILAELGRRKKSSQETAPAARAPHPDPHPDPFPDEPDVAASEAIKSLEQALARIPRDAGEPAGAELSHREQGSAFDEALDEVRDEARDGMPAARPGGIDARDSRDIPLSPAMLAAMRPHLINLSMGRFSAEGQVATSPADVDAIFEQHLPQALEQAKAAGGKLRLLFYAHGGLVSESSGLRIAAKHIEWWQRNGVYPLYFIWETGFFETIGSLLQRAQQGTMRGLPRDFWDFTLDPLTEIAARALQGPRIWGGMKAGAEHAVDEAAPGNPAGGGAWYVAGKLKKFCDAHAVDIELHAVGHSAGSIFHSYFLTLARDLGVPTFASAHFLAPAVRVDTFRQLLGSRIGNGKAAQKLTVFTMKKDFEKADNCAGIYHKSLLYLIHHALEDARGTPILGLEESLRGDAELKKLFGLAGAASAHGEVIWSPTAADTGASASRSVTHGGFDDDAPTMNSVARRVLGKADADPIIGYESARDIVVGARPWTEEVDWPEGFGMAAQLAIPQPPRVSLPASVPQPIPPPALLPETRPQPLPEPQPQDGQQHEQQGGQRRALCVGIDRYPDPRHALAGCVADARMWADTLTRFGFTATMLLDREATREAISRELLALVGNSRGGDVIVFQYSGHGTTLPDVNGGEEDGQDEAICPVDFAGGALYIDDDIAEVFERLPNGVNLTCFMDCCHSGTNTRFAVGTPPAASHPGRDERKRYIVATPELIEAHRRFRQARGGARRAFGTGGRSRMRDIKFSACLDSEVAWESDGHGEFTLRATRVLASGSGGLTNEQFQRRITAEFGAATRQHPMLDCAPGAGALAFLQPLAGAGMLATASPAAMATTTTTPATATIPDPALLAQTLMSLQQLLAQLAARQTPDGFR